MSDIDLIISLLLEKRGLKEEKDIDLFFNPPHPMDYSLADIGLDPDLVGEAVGLIESHIHDGSHIAVYGDYDVDGITGTAILWEVLYRFHPSVFPHIPHRREEGYGLSLKGIDHCIAQGAGLIITVDNGIVARQEIEYCRSKNCDVIVIDHHEPEDRLPDANVILHSVSTSAAGLAWFFTRELLSRMDHKPGPGTHSERLSLAAVSVICDMVPLLGLNRSFVRYGLEELDRTRRPGLLAMFADAGLKPPLNTYHVGFVIGPRLNAPGRLEHALDSLRLLCTTDSRRARDLALHLGRINQLRQDKTRNSSDHALSQFSREDLPKLLISASPDYDEGVVGLIASKLVEAFHRPALAISVDTDQSKGSARSIPGFHITDHLRSFSDILTSVGGHSMAAGFSLPTSRLEEFSGKAVALADKVIPDEILVAHTRIDAEISISLADRELLAKLELFEPFGLGNPRPVFKSKDIPVSGFRRLGNEGRHLKFIAGNLEAIFFSAPQGIELEAQTADIVYSVDLNTFNGRETLQLVIKQFFKKND